MPPTSHSYWKQSEEPRPISCSKVCLHSENRGICFLRKVTSTYLELNHAVFWERTGSWESQAAWNKEPWDPVFGKLWMSTDSFSSVQSPHIISSPKISLSTDRTPTSSGLPQTWPLTLNPMELLSPQAFWVKPCMLFSFSRLVSVWHCPHSYDSGKEAPERLIWSDPRMTGVTFYIHPHMHDLFLYGWACS